MADIKFANCARYISCPVCGGVMRKVAKTCKNCQSLKINLNRPFPDICDIPDNFWLEFSGMFWGEGSAMIIRNGVSFGACLSLGLRDDDSDVIYRIRETLGGRLMRMEKNSKNPRHGNILHWRESDIRRVPDICKALLEKSSFPAKKRVDVSKVLHFCEWRQTCNRYFTEEERAYAEYLFQDIRQSRVYSPVKVRE